MPRNPSTLNSFASTGKGLYDSDEPKRINRILSLVGLTSRRKADEWIRAGRVKVNGRPVTQPGLKAIWGSDSIQVDGEEIPNPSERIYLMLNKPFGCISSLNDPKGRPLVTDFLRDLGERVYPVGRLDFDTLGLLLFTNDGEWAYRLTHPRYQIPRTYKVTVEGEITEHALGLLRNGVLLEDGPSGRSKANIISRNSVQSVVRITITQGKPRQVRRMLEFVGYRVVHLVRTSFGNLGLGDLKVGKYRYLDTDEIASINKSNG